MEMAGRFIGLGMERERTSRPLVERTAREDDPIAIPIVSLKMRITFIGLCGRNGRARWLERTGRSGIGGGGCEERKRRKVGTKDTRITAGERRRIRCDASLTRFVKRPRIRARIRRKVSDAARAISARFFRVPLPRSFSR